MPIFEYACDACGAKFEKLVRRSEDVECPTCTSTRLTQQLSTFSAHANAPAKTAMPSCAGGMCRMPDVCGRN